MSWIERIVGARVRRGEGRLVLVLALDLFFLLAAYYVLKVVREPLILLGGGVASRNLARGTQAIVLLGAIPAYGAIANRVDPRRLVVVVLALFLVALVAFFFLERAGAAIGFPFFVWLGIFSTLGIAQFWSLANDLFTEEQGKRLFPAIAAGGTIGGIAGAQVAARLTGFFGPAAMMLVAAAFLIAHIALAASVAWREHDEAPLDGAHEETRGAIGLVLRDRYLLLIAASVLLLNVVNTTGDFVLSDLVNRHAHTTADPRATIAVFYGDFQTAVTVLTSLVQIFLVGRIFRWIGVGRALYLLPAFAVVGYAGIAAAPLLALAAVVKVGENSTDYSLQSTIQQALYLRTSRAAKYKGKAAIDTFVVRVGDLASAGLVALGIALGFSAGGFAAVNLVLAVLWLVVAARLAAHQGAPPVYDRSTETAARSR